MTIHSPEAEFTLNSRPMGERVMAVDALRGLALWGVVLINVIGVSMMVAGREIGSSASLADMIVAVINTALVHGKARACFAFLFGVGFGMALQRAGAPGENGTRMHLRRMGVLLIFGLVNQAFLFWGDILAHYALLGALLPLVCRWSDRTVFVTGAALILVPPLLAGAFLSMTGAPIPALSAANEGARAAAAMAAYTSSNFLDAVAFNVTFQAHAYATDTVHRLEYDLAILGLFLLGLLAARHELLTEPERHRSLLKRVRNWGLPIGFLIGGAHVTKFLGIALPGAWKGVAVAGFAGLPIMAFGIMAALILWFINGGRRLQAALAPAGKMTLTNYLVSGGIATWVFYGYGLGLLGKLNFVGMTLFALALCAALTVFSHLWLARFRFGPAEWVWRSLARGKAQPFLRSDGQAPAALPT